MKYKVSLVFIAILLFLSACGSDTAKPDADDSNSETATNTLLSKANNELGFSLLHHVASQGENIFLSPTSALFAVLMAYNGADGDTKEEIESALHVQSLSNEEINEATKQLMEHLQRKIKGIDLSIANSIWVNDEYELQEDFSTALANYFSAEAAKIDIADNNSANTINDWVKKQTNGKITDIVEAPLPDNLLAYIINALYFNGSWKYKFDKDATENMPFYTNDGEKETPFMFLNQELDYFETADFQAVKLPYSDNEMSMNIFLPNENTSLADFIASMTADSWMDWQTAFAQTEGTVVMPKFTLEYEIKLNEMLREIGINDAFDPEKADFSKMAETSKPLYISEVKQKTFVDVQEEGTEAAAVTSVEIKTTSAPAEDETFYMQIDRPFFFAIQDEKSRDILFFGTIYSPNVSEK